MRVLGFYVQKKVISMWNFGAPYGSYFFAGLVLLSVAFIFVPFINCSFCLILILTGLQKWPANPLWS
jgi:hypothetical protein